MTTRHARWYGAYDEYSYANLPASGDRIEFGAHRLAAAERTATAWPTLATVQGRRDAAYTRWLNATPVRDIDPTIGGAMMRRAAMAIGRAS